MRDYKFQKKEWPVRKNKKSATTIILKIMIVGAIVGGGYFAYQWFNSLPKDDSPQVDSNTRIIPLPIPPKRSNSSPMATDNAVHDAH